MRERKNPLRFVHIVSHGPYCLDGVTAAVAVARYHREATVVPHFSSNVEINTVLLQLECEPADAAHEVWITDISWTDPQVDRHLQALLDRGVKVYWIDHHRTALERVRSGEVGVRLTDQMLNEMYAASRLTYEYLGRRLVEEGGTNEWFGALARLVALADDNDRWVHQLPGSRELALAVSAMAGDEAYQELLHIDAGVTYTPRLRAAAQRALVEIGQSFALAEQSRVARQVANAGVQVITAVCQGYSSEIADVWGKTSPHTVFALFDAKSLTVSLRRSPDCTVDLSHLARRLGGGGHAAAAGCELPELRQQLANGLAVMVAAAVARGLATDL